MSRDFSDRPTTPITVREALPLLPAELDPLLPLPSADSLIRSGALPAGFSLSDRSEERIARPYARFRSPWPGGERHERRVADSRLPAMRLSDVRVDPSSGMPVQTTLRFNDATGRDPLPFDRATINVDRVGAVNSDLYRFAGDPGDRGRLATGTTDGQPKRIDVNLGLRPAGELTASLINDGNNRWHIHDFDRMSPQQQYQIGKFLERTGAKLDSTGKLTGRFDVTKRGSIRYQNSDGPTKIVSYLRPDGSSKNIDFGRNLIRRSDAKGNTRYTAWDGKRERKKFRVSTKGDKTTIDIQRASGEPPLTATRVVREASADGKKNFATFTRPNHERYKYDWDKRTKTKTHDRSGREVAHPRPHKSDGDRYREAKAHGRMHEFASRKPGEVEKVRDLDKGERLFEGRGFAFKKDKDNKVNAIGYRNGDQLQLSRDAQGAHGDINKLELHTRDGRRFTLERHGAESVPGLDSRMARGDGRSRDLATQRLNTWLLKDESGRVLGEKKFNIAVHPNGKLSIASERAPWEGASGPKMYRINPSGDSPRSLFNSDATTDDTGRRGLRSVDSVPVKKDIDDVARRLEEREKSDPRRDRSYPYFEPAKKMVKALLAENFADLFAEHKRWSQLSKDEPANPKNSDYNLGRCNTLLRELGINGELHLDRSGNMYLMTRRGTSNQFDALRIPSDGGEVKKYTVTESFSSPFRESAALNRDLKFKPAPGTSEQHRRELSETLKKIKERVRVASDSV